MGLHHRKMMFFQPGLNFHIPTFQIYSLPPPPPPPPPSPSPSSEEYFSLLVFTLICILGSVLLFLVLIVGLYICIPQSRRNPTVTVVPRVTNQRENEEDEEEEERDHHVWRITTDGLQRSVIDSITVVGYKKGEGIIEGTDCSVCLNEFEEDESLRLLPKCNHAFHMNCIDTWLLSHENCPLCRAPILLTESPRQETETNHQTQGPGLSNEEQESSRSRSLSRVQSDLANHCDSRSVETVRRLFSIGGSSAPKANDGDDDDIATRSRRHFYSSFNATVNLFSSSRRSRNQDSTLPIQAPSTF